MALRLSSGLRNRLLGTGSFKNVMMDGVIRIFPGVQPVSADDVEGASPLVEITVASGAFSAGVAANGLEFGEPSGGSIAKADGEIWSGAATSAGTAGWFRFYDNSLTTGADSASARFDGAISTSGAQLNMSSTAIASGATTTIDSFTITLPAA